MSLKLPCVLLTALSAASAALPAAQDIRVSPPLERVESFVGLPDGSGAVFRILQDPTTHLFRARYRLRSAPVDLDEASHDLFPGPYGVSPDGTWLVYTSSSAVEVVTCELYSQPLDGSAPPLRLNGPLAPQEDVFSFQITPDSKRATFVRLTSGDGPRLFSVPLDGSAPAVELIGPEPSTGVTPRFSPDSRFVFYVTETNGYQLCRAPLDGGGPAQALPGRGSSVATFQFSRPTGRVLYCASQETNPALLVQLFSAPVDGSGPAVAVNPPLVTGGRVDRDFELTPDGTRVVYAAEQEIDGRLELYIAPADASSSPIELSGPIGASLPRPDASHWALDVNDSRALYRAWRQSQSALGLLVSVPLDASSAPIVLHSFLRSGGPQHRLGHSHLVYLDFENGPAFHAVPLSGEEPPVRLTPPMVAGGSVSSFQLGPRGDRLLYVADQDVDGRRELYWVPLDGGRAVQRVNPPLAPGGQVGFAYQCTPDGNRVAYLAEVSQSGIPELFLDYLTPAHRAR